jgi:predicted DNA-binding protein YlxM (UPF0122 family)
MARIKYKKAAGLEVKRGKPPIGKKPSKIELKKLYIKESRSIREVAEILGCSKDMVYRSLKEYGIELRFKTRRSHLRVYELDYLRSEIDSKGYKQVAVDLEVGVTTLRDYMKAKT